MLLVDGQFSRGIEASLAGRVAKGLTVLAAYAYQDGRLRQAQSASVRAGARLAQLPAHTLSVWSRYDPSQRWGVGFGVQHRGAIYASADNLVVVPGFTRVDGALFLALSPRLGAQLNLENLLEARYYVSAHSNNNIMPGSPRAARLSLTTRF
jgi:catecholate siderophore receptor